MIKLKQGQGVNIGSYSFVVTGCISYRTATDTWDEYNLRSASGGIFWLSVDNNDNEFVLSNVASSRCPPDNYKVVDQGTAYVTGKFGDTDVDIGESVRFTEYEDDCGDRTFSVEKWEDETEYSEGHYVKEIDIQILDNPPFETRSFSSYSSSSSSDGEGFSIGSIISYIIIGIVFVLFPLASCLPDSCSDSCKSCSTSDPNYAQCKAEYDSCVQARSIRRASRRTRSSSGGGMHFGK